MRLHQEPQLPSFDATLPRATFRTLAWSTSDRPCLPPSATASNRWAMGWSGFCRTGSPHGAVSHAS